MDPTSGEETSGDVAEWISREIVGNQLADFKVEDYSRINELEIGETQFHSQQPEAQQWRTMKPFDHMTPSSGLESARRKMETESEPQERVDNIDPDRLHSRLPLLPILPEIEEGDDEFDWDDQTLPSSRRLSKSSTLFDGLESDPLLIFSSDGFRKKSARFEIPQERNLENIDALIASTNDEQEKKELKQQKRLLRNRQAA